MNTSIGCIITLCIMNVPFLLCAQEGGSIRPVWSTALSQDHAHRAVACYNATLDGYMFVVCESHSGRLAGDMVSEKFPGYLADAYAESPSQQVLDDHIKKALSRVHKEVKNRSEKSLTGLLVALQKHNHLLVATLGSLQMVAMQADGVWYNAKRSSKKSKYDLEYLIGQSVPEKKIKDMVEIQRRTIDCSDTYVLATGSFWSLFNHHKEVHAHIAQFLQGCENVEEGMVQVTDTLSAIAREKSNNAAYALCAIRFVAYEDEDFIKVPKDLYEVDEEWMKITS